MKKLLLLLVLAVVPALAQTATLRFDYSIEHGDVRGWETFMLNINGSDYLPGDTIPKRIKLNKEGFDQCYAIIAGDTLNFLAKFRKGETYIAQPGCCCAVFTLNAESDDAERGTVTFRNKTKRDLSFSVAANMDTVAAGAEKTFFASESMMCYYKPCDIVISEAAYLDPKYDYTSDDRDYKALWAEQKKHVRSINWFHFLHAEKIVVEYDDKTGKSTLKLDGYLTKEELHNAIYGD